ncbi:tRNA (cytosine(32)/uridine(32)-2'-O)-methyltransferase TrmJ [Endozoicomonas ascidiicola]|uniref:tRNA (cytosine(32)/uridine(32)-2'-O)-methyltransferase TrmJ n=1 Tax=Endozoicomonas ascidiicola TaxID=1698521 RepID=UPI00082CDB42|nr:tRNA (cytosine(32)/uridine(32)-2'-O)-methyltransferase TrmJ [Endozoicomonas ascidiicola]
MLDNISIVLVNPSHPGNIGSTARAMKTMGLSQLCLVAPDDFPSGTATALASGADDILRNAKVCETLDEALADCQFVVGTSARVRGVSLPLVDPRSCAQSIVQEASNNKVALIFGREDSGLSNEQLRRCHLQVHIPTNEDFSSLNLGAAVQVLSYEIRMAELINKDALELPTPKAHELASMDDMERYYDHLYSVLMEIGFLDHSSHEKIMAKMRRLYGRVRPDQVELGILRGILSETQRCLASGGGTQKITE